MPQTFQVLRCYKCSVFQIHQTKKSNKWQCKLCGEKQSIKRHYGLGNGKECRIHVQKLNAIRGQTEENTPVVDSNENDEFEDYDEFENYDKKNVYKETGNKSKWSAYIEEREQILQEINHSADIENEEECFERPRKISKSDFKISKEKLKCQGFKIPVHDTVKKNGSTELEKDANTSVNNSTIIFKTSNDKQKKLLSNKEQNNQEFVKKISKWDKFVEIEENEKDDDKSQVNKLFLNDSHNIFECCDDSELDLILSI